MSVPESLDYKIRSFRESGHVVYSKRELFIETNWVAVFLGQDVIPCALDLRVDCVPPENIAAQMQKMREVIKVAAESLPRHTDTISNYCPARLGDLSATQSAGH
jgi:tryptophan halogenase